MVRKGSLVDTIGLNGDNAINQLMLQLALLRTR